MAKRRNKRMLSFYAWYRRIRTPLFRSVAKFSGNKIISSNPVFIEKVQEVSTLKLEDAPLFNEGRLAYQIIDERNNQVIGKVDKALNIFTNDNLYVGTIYNQLKILLSILAYLMLFLVVLCIGLSNIKKTGILVKPDSVVISEKDGGIVTDKWNILLDMYGRKLIVPDYKSSYYFNILNKNYADCIIHIDFDEENEHDLNIEYRLSYDGKYVIGGPDKWVSVHDLYAQDIDIPAYETEKFRLDWRWNDSDEFQTAIGSEGIAEYTVKVVVTTQYKK